MSEQAKKAIADYAKRIEELEQEKVYARESLILNLKNENNLLTTEFVNWYYWETDYSLKMLSEITDSPMSGITKKVEKTREVPYLCPKCKETTFHTCYTRNDMNIFLSPRKMKRFPETYYCEKCLEIKRKKQEENIIKRAQTIESKSKNKTALLNKMPYDEFLQTKYWKKFAKERLHEAGCKCSKCGRNDITLQVHHLTYERRGHELPSDVIVLCKACHLEAHNRPVPQCLVYNPVSLRDRALQAIKQ